MDNLKNKTIVIGISGGIAAYKICALTSRLQKQGADTHIILTKHAQHFVTPLTLQTLSKNKVIMDMFDTNFEPNVQHISLAKKADILVIAPATANVIAKIAHGIADDFLTTNTLASTAPKLVCPTMNTEMLRNPITQENIKKLQSLGYHILYGEEGHLACGDQGSGRMAEPEVIERHIKKIIYPKKDLVNKTVLITAGATREDIDGVRCITNYSSGKMGIALAKEAVSRGAEVIFIHGNIKAPMDFEAKKIGVFSTDDMYNAVMQHYKLADIIIMAAAPSDYRIKDKFNQKIKSEQITLELEKNIDIAQELGKVKGDKILVIFSAETQDATVNAKDKFIKKNADMAVANNVTLEGAGFDIDTNIASLIFKDKIVNLDKMLKTELAEIIFDNILTLRKF
ncbi:MAG TPA: bifunctional phosphopantothenoylcysteine decarboxylase/phosphopantothenate--cysteine ligase CoaBC [Clostridiales bacterium]|jgi:phosphopantothenoylcysteine decarboxylase/phosphopantothenate--cysteine ligase|nr:bifunctional phosphopantothenoylcysteine decarboxylase/phosphopantothenate--cysteine ligase CoaBC [Clostridiales bacterium]